MSDKMTILVVESMKPPYVREIDGSLLSMQEIVGGGIEGVYPFEDPVAIVCNEAGKLLGLTPNRLLRDAEGRPCDVLCGTFFLAGVGAEDFCSLTDAQIQTYKNLYAKEMGVLPLRQQEHGNKQKGAHSHER